MPGVEKPVRSDRIEEYVNREFRYYHNFYYSCKHAGSPFPPGWLDWPPWVVQLLAIFNEIIDGENRNNERKFFAQIHGYKVK